ncbi:MAG: hypothetical protein FWG63_10165 [Defluviitaleaceae bacterium]|nr:hypothetical protein [Defluviitaleaceae bacterium]
MAITDTFRSAVSAGDVRGIRIMMKDSMLVDPTFSEFNQMDNTARGVAGLYEAHDGREINNDSSTWDDDYMNKLMVQVVGNFSRERVDHLKKVVMKLRPVTTRPQQSTVTSRPVQRQTTPQSGKSYQEQKWQDEQSGRIISYRSTKIAAGAVAGGVVGGTIAVAANLPVIAGAAAGAVVVGTVVTVATKEE